MLRSDWTLRWWDLIALVAALLAAGLLARYAISRDNPTQKKFEPARIELMVFQPLPEVMKLLSSPKMIFDQFGYPVGDIISIQPLPPQPGPAAKEPGVSLPDYIIQVYITKPLPQVYGQSGRLRPTSDLKLGSWCLIITDQVELSGMIRRLERTKP